MLSADLARLQRLHASLYRHQGPAQVRLQMLQLLQRSRERRVAVNEMLVRAAEQTW